MQTDPYNWPFPKRTDTMSLSTINDKDFGAPKKFMRESTFQAKDLHGASPTKLIPEYVHKTSFNLSSYIEPRNTGFKKLEKQSDPLKTNDIEGTSPNAVGFTTKRVVDPVCPVYKLPSCGPISIEEGRPFLRDTLKVDDIVKKRLNHFERKRGIEMLHQPIPGAQSIPRTHASTAVPRLTVEDINKEGTFKSTRATDPLNPMYKWRDELDKLDKVNQKYGKIEGNETRERHQVVINKENTRHLNVADIEGAYHNSYFDRVHFLQKRREFRNYMKTDDIDKAQSSSLKKGITSNRLTNPLVPRYKMPGQSQIKAAIPYPQ